MWHSTKFIFSQSNNSYSSSVKLMSQFYFARWINTTPRHADDNSDQFIYADLVLNVLLCVQGTGCPSIQVLTLYSERVVLCVWFAVWSQWMQMCFIYGVMISMCLWLLSYKHYICAIIFIFFHFSSLPPLTNTQT